MTSSRDPLDDLETLIARVYAYVAYRVGHGPEAEDVTNDTFERALRYRESYDRSKGEPIAWLLGIARRCIDDSVARRPPMSELREDVAAAGDQEAEALDRIALREAVLTLEPRDRDLIALRYGADLKASQIAELLGERTNTVEVALHRALRRLRSSLHDEGARDESRSGVRIEPEAEF
jgi:RNA polymerase sigma factor (sigma-70 family)